MRAFSTSGVEPPGVVGGGTYLRRDSDLFAHYETRIEEVKEVRQGCHHGQSRDRDSNA